MSDHMTPAQASLAAVVRGLLQSQLGDIYDCRMAGGVVLPWICCHSNGSSVTVVSSGPSGDNLKVAMTAGLARDVPVSAGLKDWVNNTNTTLPFGRVFWKQQQDSQNCAVLLQEYVPGDYIHEGNIDTQYMMLAALGPPLATGWSLAPEVVQRFGGRLFDREDAWLVSFLS